MKKGRLLVIDVIDQRSAAALLFDGQMIDLLIDPVVGTTPQVEAIYRARTQQPIKGQNGILLDLGQGQSGFLRQTRGIAPGTTLLVQISTTAEPAKAAPVTTRLLFKSRYAIVTPGAAGLNIARTIKDDNTRDRLLCLANEALAGAPDDLGLILRSACEDVDDADILDDIIAMRALNDETLAQDNNDAPGLLVPAPDARLRAWRDWCDPFPDQIIDEADSFDTLGIWDHIEALRSPHVPLQDGASMAIEPTTALVAVDVNTGRDFSLNAGQKANFATAKALPTQLRLRGLGGQITIDFAPMAKSQRRALEQCLKQALRRDTVETILAGWTPLGHFELQRKRDRLPLLELLP